MARGVEGVTRVENELLVRPAGDGTADAPRHHAQDGPASARDSRTPAWITAKIQSQYYLNPELKPWRIDVDTSAVGRRDAQRHRGFRCRSRGSRADCARDGGRRDRQRQPARSAGERRHDRHDEGRSHRPLGG